MSIKVKDLPANERLEGKKLRTKKNVVGYYHSRASDIVFFSDVKGALNEDGRLYPQIMLNSNIIKDWEVIEDDNVMVNCDKKTELKFTTN